MWSSGGRTFQILDLSGRWNAVATATSIPRPTVYRLLETLEGLGFVSRDHSSEKWRPTLQAKSLSSGFRHEDWVTQSAVPEMVRLGREILWPLDLVTFNDYQMEIRESTHNISPYSIDHGMVGLQLPVLDTAGGRAYLAFVRQAGLPRSGDIAGRTAKTCVGYLCEIGRRLPQGRLPAEHAKHLCPDLSRPTGCGLSDGDLDQQRPVVRQGAGPVS